MLKRTESFHLKILPLVLLFAIPMVLSFLTFNNREPPGYLTKKDASEISAGISDSLLWTNKLYNWVYLNRC